MRGNAASVPLWRKVVEKYVLRKVVTLILGPYVWAPMYEAFERVV